MKLEASVGMNEIALGALLEAYRGNEALVKIDKCIRKIGRERGGKARRSLNGKTRFDRGFW